MGRNGSGRISQRKDEGAVRAAVPEDMGPLARLWWQGWREAHIGLVPEALVAGRTQARFAERLALFGAGLRVAGPQGAPLGFCHVREDEIDQLFVGPEARGTGVAAALLADGAARIAAAGYRLGWLSCAIGNDRAARFYVREGWQLARTVQVELALPEGAVPLQVWRFEKVLG